MNKATLATVVPYISDYAELFWIIYHICGFMQNGSAYTYVRPKTKI